MSEEFPYLTTAGVALLLGVGRCRVKQILASGELVGHKHGDRWAVSEWDLRSYMERRRGPGRPRVGGEESGSGD